jgi:triacylglycerol lipase
MPVQPSNVSQSALTDRNPVFLVHGLMDTSYKMRTIASYLRGLGWEVFDIDLCTNDGSTRLEILARQLSEKIDRTFAPDSHSERLCLTAGYRQRQRPIDLLGFSMGGLVSRYYLQRLGGMQRVQRFITISTPHNGTIAANFSRRSGCMQMRPNSAFMQDLSSDVDRLTELNFTSLWTPFDLIILPPSSSQLGISTERSIPVLAHPLMVSDRRVLLAISEALSQPAKSPMRSNSVAPNIDSECV